MSLKKKYFVVIEDHDERQYAVSPPVLGRYVDEWLKSVCTEQEKGRHINCSDVEETNLTAQINHVKSNGYTEVTPSEIMSQPRDRTNDYVGNLPKYAQSADRSRIVHILCKGKCSKPRLAEVNRSFSSMAELKNAEMGEYEAICLKCGSSASDNYNWYQ